MYQATKAGRNWTKRLHDNAIYRALQLFEYHVEQVLLGKRVGVFAYGGSGMGKNHVVERVLKRSQAPTPVLTNPKVFHELLGAFHRATHRRESNPRPVILDEADLIFRSVPNFNVMKMATDWNGKRFWEDFTWEQEEEVETEDGELKLKKVKHRGTSLAAPIIAMTNHDLDEIGGKERDHADALFSRVQPIPIPSDRTVAWEYTVGLALGKRMLDNIVPNGVPLRTRARAIEWFTSEMWALRQVSPRTLVAITRSMALTSPEFLEDELDLYLLPFDQRIDRRPPAQHDWAELKQELDQTMAKAA